MYTLGTLCQNSKDYFLLEKSCSDEVVRPFSVIFINVKIQLLKKNELQAG